MVPRLWRAWLACSLLQIKDGSVGTCPLYVASSPSHSSHCSVFRAARGCWVMGETRLELKLGGSLLAPKQLLLKLICNKHTSESYLLSIQLSNGKFLN